LPVAGVGSFLTARCGALRAATAPWPRAKSLAAGLLLILKQALSDRNTCFICDTDEHGSGLEENLRLSSLILAYLRLMGEKYFANPSPRPQTTARFWSHSRPVREKLLKSNFSRLVHVGRADFLMTRYGTAFCPKTLRAAGLLPVARVGSFLTPRCGALRAATAPWPRPTSLAAGLLLVLKPALSAGGHQISHREKFDNPLSLNEVAEPSPINRLAGTPKLKPGRARLPPNREFAFDYLASFAVPPQLPQASAPKRLSADSRPQLFPTSAFFILPSAFAFSHHSPAILPQSVRGS